MEGFGNDWWSQHGLEQGKIYDYQDGQFTEFDLGGRLGGDPVAGYGGPYVTRNAVRNSGIDIPEWARMQSPNMHTEDRMLYPGYSGAPEGYGGTYLDGQYTPGRGQGMTSEQYRARYGSGNRQKNPNDPGPLRR